MGKERVGLYLMVMIILLNSCENNRIIVDIHNHMISDQPDQERSND